MSVLVRDMEMPKGGYRTVEIVFDADGHPMALADGGDVFDVIPVPPHGRLIDADAVAKMVLDSVNQEDAQGFMFTKIICQILKDAPTIIQAEEE